MFGRENAFRRTNLYMESFFFFKSYNIAISIQTPMLTVNCFNLKLLQCNEAGLLLPEIGLASGAEHKQLVTSTATVRRRQGLPQTEGVSAAAAPPQAGRRSARRWSSGREPPRCERPANNNGRAVLHITARIVRRIRLVGRGGGSKAGYTGGVLVAYHRTRAPQVSVKRVTIVCTDRASLFM